MRTKLFFGIKKTCISAVRLRVKYAHVSTTMNTCWTANPELLKSSGRAFQTWISAWRGVMCRGSETSQWPSPGGLGAGWRAPESKGVDEPRSFLKSWFSAESDVSQESAKMMVFSANDLLHNPFSCFPHPIKSKSYKREFVENWGYAEVS